MTEDWTSWPAAWLVMLLAMLPPVLREPVSYVWRRSLVERRIRAVAIFITGYFGTWLLAIASLHLTAMALRAAVGDAALPVAILVASAWHLAPARDRALRRCHALLTLPVFGMLAELARLKFGYEASLACVVTRWALMPLPLTSEVWHLPAMAATLVAMVADGYSPPSRPVAASVRYQTSRSTAEAPASDS